jgi:hypothetical protein
MSWIAREEKKRQRHAARLASRPSTTGRADLDSAVGLDGEQAMRQLWEQLESANSALPAALRLQREPVVLQPRQGPRFQVWLKAPNGAALGFSGDAVRYVWPQKNARRSHNFWIRFNHESGWHEVNQRVSSAVPPVMQSWRFDEGRVERLIQALVTGRRVKARSLRKRRFWLF